MWRRLIDQTPLLVLIALFLVLTRLYGTTVRPFEGPDEYRHFGYITELAQEGRLPHPIQDVHTVIQQQAGQPPLYYLSTALWVRLRGLDRWEVNPQTNPWWEQNRSGRLDDNLNHFLMSPSINVMSNDQRHLIDVLNWTRLTLPLCTILAIVGDYWSGLALWRDKGHWALLGAMALALTPQLLQDLLWSATT